LTPAADLLVGREGDLHRAVPEIGVLDDPRQRIEDLGDARLVVGAQQRGAVGGDDGLADALLQVGVLGGDDLLPVLRQGDVLAVVVRVEGGHHVLARHVGIGVHVGDEGDDRHLLAARRGRQRRR
jgi:hypothetical protein